MKRALKRLLPFACIGLSGLCSQLNAASLIQVYNQALVNDMTFRAAEAQWLSNQEATPLARAALLPSLNAGGDLMYNHSSGVKRASNGVGVTAITEGKYWNYGYNINLSQSIFNYTSWAALAGAKNAVKASEATYNAAAQSLISRTILAYTQVLSDYETLRTQQAQSNYLYQYLRSQRKKYQVGLLAITDVYDVQSQYDLAIASEISDQNTLSDDIEKLRSITGQSYTKLNKIRNSIPLRTPSPNNINQWVNRSLSQNFTVINARYAALASHDTVQQATGSLLPNLAATAQYGGNHTNSGENAPFKSQNHTLAGLQLNVPIFAGGLNYTTLRQNEYNYQVAQADLTGSERTATQQTRSDYLSIIADISLIRADKQAIISSTEALNSNEKGYQVGTKTITDVLLAVSKLYAAKKDYIAAQYKYINDTVKLKQDVGTLSLGDLKSISRLLTQPVTLPRPLMSGTTYQATTGSGKVKRHIPKAKKPTLKQLKKHELTYAGTYTHKPTNRYYVIQLYSSDKLSYSTQFYLHRYNKKNMNIIRHTKNGHTNYKVTIGWHTTRSAAESSLKKLPKTYHAYGPWIYHTSVKDTVIKGPKPKGSSTYINKKTPAHQYHPAAKSSSQPSKTLPATPITRHTVSPVIIGPKVTTKTATPNSTTNGATIAAPSATTATPATNNQHLGPMGPGTVMPTEPGPAIMGPSKTTTTINNANITPTDDTTMQGMPSQPQMNTPSSNSTNKTYKSSPPSNQQSNQPSIPPVNAGQQNAN